MYRLLESARGKYTTAGYDPCETVTMPNDSGTAKTPDKMWCNHCWHLKNRLDCQEAWDRNKEHRCCKCDKVR